MSLEEIANKQDCLAELLEIVTNTILEDSEYSIQKYGAALSLLSVLIKENSKLLVNTVDSGGAESE